MTNQQSNQSQKGERTADGKREARATIGTDTSSPLASYDELLSYYVELLGQAELNPYQSPIVLFLKGLNPRFQLKVWKSIFIRDFYYSPNVLKQELVGGADMLAKLRTLSYSTLELIIVMNELNLKRLHNRSVLNWFNKLAIGIGSLFGLAAALQTATGVNIWHVLPLYGKSLLLELFIGAAIGGVINVFIVLPSIGLVRAFGDILKIARVNQIN